MLNLSGVECSSQSQVFCWKPVDWETLVCLCSFPPHVWFFTSVCLHLHFIMFHMLVQICSGYIRPCVWFWVCFYSVWISLQVFFMLFSPCRLGFCHPFDFLPFYFFPSFLLPWCHSTVCVHGNRIWCSTMTCWFWELFVHLSYCLSVIITQLQSVSLYLNAFYKDGRYYIMETGTGNGFQMFIDLFF